MPAAASNAAVRMARKGGVGSEAWTRRVLIVTYDFPPSMEIGAQACAQIARHLPVYGWEPIVLTAREHYFERCDGSSTTRLPVSVIRTLMLPHPLTIYRRLKKRIKAEGEDGAGGNAWPSESGAVRRWALSLLMIPDQHTGWIIPATIAGVRVIRQLRVRHLFSSGPYWTNHLVGLAVARLTRVPWTVHLRDPWTQAPEPKPMSALSVWLERVLEKMVMRRADSVVCVTEEHTSLLRHVYSHLPFSKFVTIPNGYDGTEWDDMEAGGAETGPKKADQFVITYAGSLNLGRRSPLPLFRALRALLDSGDVAHGRIRVDLFGWCDMAEGRPVGEMAAEHGLNKCVHIMGPLNRPETLRRMAQSDLLLLLAEGWTVQIPGKTYEYLRAGRPILALTSDGALANLLRRTGGTWMVDPTDGDGIATALREAYGAWQQGRRARVADRTVVSQFDRRVLAGQFAKVFEASASKVSVGV